MLTARHILAALVLTLPLLGGCSWFSNLVYKPDITQGNYIEQAQVDELRKGMTKEQVKFVIGTPMVVEAFDDSIWFYIYQLKSGKTGKVDRRQLILKFDQEQRLVSAEGDFDLHEDFDTPLSR